MGRTPAIDFRRMIVDFLREKGRLAGQFFFGESDEKAVMLWPNNVAKRVWNMLRYNVFTENVDGISKYTCPFCIRYKYFGNSCAHCEWGDIHGKCRRETSDVWRIKGLNRFTNAFYRRTMKKIEKKHMGV